MTDQPPHEYWMAEALRQARRGLYSTHPNPRVGCVVVKDRQLLCAGFHALTGGAHAEVNALKQIESASDCDVYITLEPCSHHGRTPPCVDALIAAKPARVIVAMQDPNPRVAGQGLEKLRLAKIEVICGVLEEQARALNCGFVSRFENKRPFVRLKMAASLDGKTALNNGESQWITGEAARRDVQFLRARASAILTSASTVLDDNPTMNLRLSKNELAQQCDVKQPVRVIIDSQLRLTGKEKIFQSGGEIWIYTLNANEKEHRQLQAAGADITLLQSTDLRVNLKQLMTDLASREINEVHSECGQTLAGALLQQGLVDEIVLYMAPKLLGSAARGLFELGELTDMNSARRCKINQIRTIGEDIRITLTPEQS